MPVSFRYPVIHTAIAVMRASHPSPRRRSLSSLPVASAASFVVGVLFFFTDDSSRSTYSLFEFYSRISSTPSNAMNMTTRERMRMTL